MENEAKIKDLMKKLHCTRDEAIEMMDYDDETDHMTVEAINAEMTPEERAAKKAATKVGRKPGSKNTKPRKENVDKRALINAMTEALTAMVGEVNVSNPEKMIDFEFNGVNYSFSLIAHRAKKD